MVKKKIVMLIAFFAFVLIALEFSYAKLEATVCCEKTKSGLYCQDVPANECAPEAKQVPSACESTSYCKPGTCYDSTEGICSDNTPQLVCNMNKGIWSAEIPPQCDLGCCILGNQAAFVSLVRCKRLSSFLGLQTNYRKDIINEVQCIQSVQKQDRGACVYDFEFERICKFTTREECDEGINGTNIKGEFYKNKLCSAEELNTKCGPTTKTTCVPGKDEVYFVDSCGNPANIYDASKINDKEYWTNIKDKTESCGVGKSNGNSVSCGNCNYLLGSYCRKNERGGLRPTYGDYICADLNCKDTQNGKSYKHGESWCVYNDKGEIDKGKNSVGSRFYKHMCINGEELVEQCAEYRQEECIEGEIETSTGPFLQAACRVNRWQDCIAQTKEEDCLNIDRRDCFWMAGKDYALFQNKSEKAPGICLPKNPPGLKFWEGEQAKAVCMVGNKQCIVKYEKGLFDKEPRCVENCHCLTQQWINDRSKVCSALGDCGPKINWIGEAGYKKGYDVTIKKE